MIFCIARCAAPCAPPAGRDGGGPARSRCSVCALHQAAPGQTWPGTRLTPPRTRCPRRTSALRRMPATAAAASSGCRRSGRWVRPHALPLRLGHAGAGAAPRPSPPPCSRPPTPSPSFAAPTKPPSRRPTPKDIELPQAQQVAVLEDVISRAHLVWEEAVASAEATQQRLRGEVEAALREIAAIKEELGDDVMRRGAQAELDQLKVRGRRGKRGRVQSMTPGSLACWGHDLLVLLIRSMDNVIDAACAAAQLAGPRRPTRPHRLTPHPPAPPGPGRGARAQVAVCVARGRAAEGRVLAQLPAAAAGGVR